jgi:hypothetical protein
MGRVLYSSGGRVLEKDVPGEIRPLQSAVVAAAEAFQTVEGMTPLSAPEGEEDPDTPFC